MHTAAHRPQRLIGDAVTSLVDQYFPTHYPAYMNAVEFITELRAAAVLTIPSEVAAQLPKAGRARVIVLTDKGTDDAE